jgi:hypothetical protein
MNEALKVLRLSKVDDPKDQSQAVRCCLYLALCVQVYHVQRDVATSLFERIRSSCTHKTRNLLIQVIQSKWSLRVHVIECEPGVLLVSMTCGEGHSPLVSGKAYVSTNVQSSLV